MPPFRNPVEARRKKDRPVQKVADENCYMSSADFSEKYHNTRQGAVTDRRVGTIPAKDRERFEAWARKPAREVPALKESAKRPPTWRK